MQKAHGAGLTTLLQMLKRVVVARGCEIKKSHRNAHSRPAEGTTTHDLPLECLAKNPKHHEVPRRANFKFVTEPAGTH